MYVENKQYSTVGSDMVGIIQIMCMFIHIWYYRFKLIHKNGNLIVYLTVLLIKKHFWQ